MKIGTVFKYIVPSSSSFFLNKISKKLGRLETVPIVSDMEEFNCHNNVEKYILDNSCKRINGYYVLMNLHDGVYEFIRHSIVEKEDNLFDITEFKNHNEICFISTDKELNELSKHMFFLNGKFETDFSLLRKISGKYYIYGLFDENKTLPFYIGKGSGDRAFYHLTENCLERDTNLHKVNKIKKIGIKNIKIKTKYKNILDDWLAYDLEEIIINSYGIKNLTNICANANPPNHKGKTYEEIYGVEEAKIQKEKRSQNQIDAGGYGPNKHSEDTKQKMRESHKNRKPISEETRNRMSKSMIGKNKGKKYSDETNKKKGRSGEENGNFGPQEKSECTYCGKIGGKAIMKRWHFENCKYRAEI